MRLTRQANGGAWKKRISLGVMLGSFLATQPGLSAQAVQKEKSTLMSSSLDAKKNEPVTLILIKKVGRPASTVIVTLALVNASSKPVKHDTRNMPGLVFEDGRGQRVTPSVFNLGNIVQLDPKAIEQPPAIVVAPDDQKVICRWNLRKDHGQTTYGFEADRMLYSGIPLGTYSVFAEYVLDNHRLRSNRMMVQFR